MFDPEGYREVCRALRAPGDKIEEVITMTNQSSKKRRRPVRTLLIAAAAVAMMVVGVSAANPDMVQELVFTILESVQVGEYRQELTFDNGETFTGLRCPQAAVEDRDGRTVLVLDGEAAADMTEALERDGRYVYEYADEGTELTVTVEGSAGDWDICVRMGVPGEEPAVTYQFSSGEEGAPDPDEHVEAFLFEEQGADPDSSAVTYSEFSVSHQD